MSQFAIDVLRSVTNRDNLSVVDARHAAAWLYSDYEIAVIRQQTESSFRDWLACIAPHVHEVVDYVQNFKEMGS